MEGNSQGKFGDINTTVTDLKNPWKDYKIAS
jgi:hypothetical protein